MNSTSPSLFAKALAAAIGFALMAVVPLLTMQYVARAHAEPPTPTMATHQCLRACPTDAQAACPATAMGCARSACATEHCLAN